MSTANEKDDDEKNGASVVASTTTTTTNNINSTYSRQKLGIPASISKQGWFTELETMWPGQKFSLALEEFSVSKSILFHERSACQDILVFRSAQYGNVLCLDGVIQMTERDEFAFHEMLVHIPLFAHAHPQTVCVVGGGDGAALREILRHDTVRRVVLVEIDPLVIYVAQTFFPKTQLVSSLADKRVEIVHQDAATYMNQMHSKNQFDIILSDTSDPVGPAESLFQPSFYESMYEALRPNGIVCAQAECFWIHLDLISDLVACCADIFETAEYASTMVPTYPCGQIGFVLACKDRLITCRYPRPRRSPENQEAILEKARWYSFQQHAAAFTLPPFVEQRLEQKRFEQSEAKQAAALNGDRFQDEYSTHSATETGDEQQQQQAGCLGSVKTWFKPAVETAFVEDGDDDDPLLLEQQQLPPQGEHSESESGGKLV